MESVGTWAPGTGVPVPGCDSRWAFEGRERASQRRGRSHFRIVRKCYSRASASRASCASAPVTTPRRRDARPRPSNAPGWYLHVGGVQLSAVRRWSKAKLADPLVRLSAGDGWGGAGGSRPEPKPRMGERRRRASSIFARCENANVPGTTPTVGGTQPNTTGAEKMWFANACGVRRG